MAHPQRPAVGEPPAENVAHAVLGEGQAALEALAPKHFLKLRRARIAQAQLEADAPEERFVSQIRRLQIRREYEHLLERHFHPLAGDQGQVVHALLERDNPAVEQVRGPHLLAAEVVDQHDSAVGFQLQRRLVEPAPGTPQQIQSAERQLAASSDKRAMHLHPPLIQARYRRLTTHRPVDERVEHFDNGPVHFDRVGQVDRIAQHARDALGHGRFAVARCAEQEQRRAGLDRWTNAVAHHVRGEQVRKRLPHPRSGDQVGVDRLRVDRRNVVGDRHR